MRASDSCSVESENRLRDIVVRAVLEEEAPITHMLLGCMIGVFLIELWMLVQTPAESLQVVAQATFVIEPAIGWALSPLLHGSFQHFIGNFVVLLILGNSVEKHWSTWRYICFLIVTGYLSTLSGGALLALFTNQQIASYGSSGIGFALCAFGLVHFVYTHPRLNQLQWVTILLGITALSLVIVDPFTGPYLDPGWINGGHLAGFVIGGLVGWYDWSGCSIGGSSFMS